MPKRTWRRCWDKFTRQEIFLDKKDRTTQHIPTPEIGNAPDASKQLLAKVKAESGKGYPLERVLDVESCEESGSGA